MTGQNHNNIYERLASRYLWRSRWYNLRQDDLRAPDGSEFTYTLVEKPDAVWIVPVTPQGEIVLINQYRYTIGTWCLEVPAGNIEPGHTPEEMAARELREEVGGTAAQLVPVTAFYTMNGIGTEQANIFLARDVALSTPAHEATELIELRRVPVTQALHMARNGAITDGPSALALLLCEPLLRDYQTEQTP